MSHITVYDAWSTSHGQPDKTTNVLFSEKLFPFMLAKPVSKWEMPVGNYTAWNMVLAQMVPWEPIPFPPPMTHSQPSSRQQDQADMYQEPSSLIWNHLSLIQVTSA